MSWYEDWFWSDAYTSVYDHRDEAEAKRLGDLIERELAPAPDAHILDVGCGRGRHARDLARRGHRVTGIDLSEAAIEEARTMATDEGLGAKLSFRMGDMREPVCDGCADGVVNLFTSFGYFEDDAENERALAAMTTALRPGGWFLQDFLNAPVVANSLGTSEHETEDGATIRQERWIENGRVNKEITIEHDEGTETFQESIRLFTVYDFEEMYASVGLELVELFGTYDGDDYDPDASPRLLLHARKTAS
ncbi:MAG: cyclopropane-fatty-acyl-phospholipid synthase family protein [Salinibacter sp.]